MANQLKMAEHQAIIGLAQLNWSYRRIAIELGIDRQTVSRHVKALATAGEQAVSRVGCGPGDPSGAGPPDSNATISITGSAPGAAPDAVRNEEAGLEANATISIAGSSSMSEPSSARKELAAVCANATIVRTGTQGMVVAPIGRRSGCELWRAIIVQGLEQGLTARRIWQDLGSEHGFGGDYQTVQRFVRKLKLSTPLPFRRMECEPGAEGQVDFGRGAPVAGPDGKRKTSWVFRIILSHSRKGYSEAVSRQGTDEFLRCLENAFAHFGGVPKTLVIDNLRAAVTRADWFDPELCPKARSFAEHYDTVFLPTRPYTPRHKGKVENGVKYVKNNALKGRIFTSLAEQNQHLLQWETAVADRRIHGTTRRQVSTLFEGEKPSLLPLPPSRFELFSEALRSVSRDGHVQVKGAYYSAPPEYMGGQVWARWDGRVVRLFNQRMQPIAVHAQKAPGQFATLDAHILPEKISGIERGTTWLLRRISYIGPQAQAWAESMLQNRGIEGVRVLLGLLSLRRKHSPREIERACRIASGHESWRLRSLRLLIERGQPSIEQSKFEFASEHPIIRPVADYGQWLRSALSGGPSTDADRALPAAQECVP
jgi:transposase